MHFNLNHNLKQLEISNADCEIVKTKISISSKLINECIF